MISMNLTPANTTVNTAFFQPISGLARRSSHARACPDFSDDDYLQCGLLRVLESSTSGRAFLQEHGARLHYRPSQANYFATLPSSLLKQLYFRANWQFGRTAGIY